MVLLDWLVILAAIGYGVGGFRNGAVVGVLSLIGFFGGAAVGAQLAGPISSQVVDGRAQVLIAVVCVLVFAVLGQLLGTWVAARIRSRVRTLGPVAVRLDRGLGSLIGVCAVLFVAWLIAVPLASSPYPTLASQASHSKIIRTVDDAMPDGVRQVYSSLRDLFDQSGFPPVFGDLPSAPNVSVAPPDPALGAKFNAVIKRVHPSVLKVYGDAPSCSRGIEGTGFVYAPERMITNAHVVAGTDRVRVQSSDGSQLRASVVVFDSDRDVAVLEVPGLKAPALSFAAVDAESGDPAAVLGYPGDGPFTVKSARVGSRVVVRGNDIYGSGTVRREMYAVRAIVRSGNSGGPLLAEDGKVLGVVFATALDSPDVGYVLTDNEVSDAVNAGRTADSEVDTGRCTP